MWGSPDQSADFNVLTPFRPYPGLFTVTDTVTITVNAERPGIQSHILY